MLPKKSEDRSCKLAHEEVGVLSLHTEDFGSSCLRKVRGEEILMRRSTVQMTCVMCRGYGPCGDEGVLAPLLSPLPTGSC